jgi:signal transduction histidine kinase
MTSPRSAPPPSSLGRFAAERLIPATLLLLPVLVAGLVYNAWAAERSHRAAAENAVRDYAAFAAWQFNRQARGILASHLSMSVAPAHELALAVRRGVLPPPDAMVAHTEACDCGFRQEARFAFRVDLRREGGGRVVASVPLSAALRSALAQRLDTEGLEPLVAQRARGRAQDALRRASRLRFDTLEGSSYALAYALLGDSAGRPVAVYGLVADAQHTGVDLARDVLRGGQPLLPPSLVGRVPNDSVLAVRVARADGGSLLETRRAVAPGDFTAQDTIPPGLGGLVTTAAIPADLAPSLVIGGLPRSRLPMSLALLGASAVVSLVAVAHLRRGRELARARSQFVANISHELRTPLAQISMFSETLMLERGRSAEERHHFLSVIFREARRLTNLVDGVLRFSRGETAGDGVHLEVRDISADVRQAVHSFQLLAADAILRVEAATPAWALADAGAIRQILLNLLDNAIKYGPPEQTVIVRAAVSDGGVVISVEDQGVGIDPADRERVLEPFTRIERPDAPRVSGSGIGLALVRDLVAAHGGRLTIAGGAGGRGTRVSFTLRVAGTPAQMRPVDSSGFAGAAR